MIDQFDVERTRQSQSRNGLSLSEENVVDSYYLGKFRSLKSMLKWFVKK